MAKRFESDQDFVKDLAAKLAEKSGRAYYVGGCVRDALLGKENKDIDIEIHSIPPNELEELLRTYGDVNVQGKSFGVYRVEGYDVDISQPRTERQTGDKHTDFAVNVDPYMGCEMAARRRDFTINAMMQDVLTGEVIDPFHGQEDLQKGIIRHVNDDTFIEDPLRILRGAQFAARFGFEIAPETKKLMSSIDLSSLSRERVNEEMKKAMMRSDKPSRFFETLRETGQLDTWFPELKTLIDSPQNELYHPEGDVWVHTMQVVDSLAKETRSGNRSYALMLSGLCHDMGKPATTTWNEKKGVHQNIGHEEAGVAPATAFLDRVVHDNSVKKHVLELVEHHGKPRAYYSTKAKTTKTNLFYDGLHHQDDMVRLAVADFTGKDVDAEAIQEYKGWLQERLETYRERLAEPFVQGEDLVRAGMKPSPEFSGILAEARKQHFCYTDKDVVLRNICKTHGLQMPAEEQKSAGKADAKGIPYVDMVKVPGRWVSPVQSQHSEVVVSSPSGIMAFLPNRDVEIADSGEATVYRRDERTVDVLIGDDENLTRSTMNVKDFFKELHIAAKRWERSRDVPVAEDDYEI